MSGPIAVSGPRAVVLRFDAPIHGVPVHELEPQLEGFDLGHAFSDLGHAISHAASDVGHFVDSAVHDVGKAVDSAVHDVGKAVSDATKWVGHAIAHPDQAISEATTWVVHAVRDIGNFVGHNIVTFVQLVQLGVSFIPGIGGALSAVIGASLALAEGKSITDVLIAAALGALPGGPLVQMAASIATEAISGVIEHKSFADIVGNVVADNIPGGGELAKAVVHGAAGVIGAATTGHDVGQALVSGVTSAVGSAVGGQIPIPAAISTAVGGAAGKVAGALGKTVVNAAGQVVSDVASGKRLDQAVAGAAAGVVAGAARGQLPGGARGVFDTATGAASQVIQGKPLDMVALGAVRAKLPGGPDALRAFDTALALTHAKNVQQAGIKHPESLLPANDPEAHKFFHATRVVVAVGLKAPHGTSFDTLHKLQLKALHDHIRAGAPRVPRPVHPRRRPVTGLPWHQGGRHGGYGGHHLYVPTAHPTADQAPSHVPARRSSPRAQPSYARAVLHPASAPPLDDDLDGLFDDLIHRGVSAAANIVQEGASAASSLPGPAGALARAIEAPAAAAAKVASATSPSSASSPSSGGAKARPRSVTPHSPATTRPEEHSSLVVPLAVGGAALAAAAGGAAWWVHMDREHRAHRGKGRGGR
jgi:hypothetical protein